METNDRRDCKTIQPLITTEFKLTSETKEKVEVIKEHILNKINEIKTNSNVIFKTVVTGK